MDCSYFDAGRCRSCTLIELPYRCQLADKQRLVEELLPAVDWSEPLASPEHGFRNKAKMVVGGTIAQPTLGILDRHNLGVDLQGCGLHEPELAAALPVLAGFLTRAQLAPYDVNARRGELKYVIATISPDGELMVRFVLRSQESLARIRKHLAWLLDQLPAAKVVSVNLQPEHKAVLEGEQEIVLTDQGTLPMRVNDLTLHLRPQSFFQTNTAMAAALYRQARDWAPRSTSVLDLYCGVGGFALHLAAPGRRVTGVEVSAEAVASARQSAKEAGLAARFQVADATALQYDAAELVVVNPPRRGIGDVAGWLERSEAGSVLYSSCHAPSLARDLAAMPSWRPVRGRLLDMFPQTGHYEALVELARR